MGLLTGAAKGLAQAGQDYAEGVLDSKMEERRAARLAGIKQEDRAYSEKRESETLSESRTHKAGLLSEANKREDIQATTKHKRELELKAAGKKGTPPKAPKVQMIDDAPFIWDETIGGFVPAPMGVAGPSGMDETEASTLAEDMADNISTWGATDATDFSKWGGKKAFISQTKQRLMSGEQPEDIMGKPTQAPSGPTEAGLRAALKSKGMSDSEIEKDVQEAVRSGRITKAATKAPKIPAKESVPAKPLTAMEERQKAKAEGSSLSTIAEKGAGAVGRGLLAGVGAVSPLFTGDVSKDKPLAEGLVRSWASLDPKRQSQAIELLRELAKAGDKWAETELKRLSK